MLIRVQVLRAAYTGEVWRLSCWCRAAAPACRGSWLNLIRLLCDCLVWSLHVFKWLFSSSMDFAQQLLYSLLRCKLKVIVIVFMCLFLEFWVSWTVMLPPDCLLFGYFELLLIFSEDSFLLTNAKIISKKSRLFDRDLLAYFSSQMLVIWWYVLISISVCA